MESKTLTTVLAVCVVAALTFVGGVVAAGVGADGPATQSTSPAATGTQSPVEPTKSSTDAAPISLSASGQVKAQPDEAVVRVTVEAIAKKPEDARNQVAKNTSALLDQLRSMGLEDDQLRTNGYGIRKIEPDGDHDEDDEHLPTPAYRARHSLRIEVQNLDRVGTVVTEATDAGGAEVGGIKYQISREKRKQLKKKALDRAMKSAEAKAQTIADRGKLQVVGIKSVSTQRVRVPNFRVRRVSYAATDAARGKAQVETKPQSGKKTVIARVSVTFNATNVR